MHRARAALLVVLAAGLIASVPSAELDSDGFAPVRFADVIFHEADLLDARGMRLHADVYLPDAPLSADAPTAFPTILVLSPYWGDGTNGQALNYMPYDFLVRRLVPRGYAVVYGDLAGSGGSSGCWDFMGPVERAGAVAMVEAIARQPWSDGKVGMMGISYDAMTQVMAASAGAPSLVTVVPTAPLTHAYGGLWQNGVRYDGGWRTAMVRYEQESIDPPGTNVERYHGWRERLVATPTCAAENHLSELGLDSYSDYYEARDHRALGANVTASVFYIQGFNDTAVRPDHFGAWFDGVPTLKKAWLGDWAHQYPNARGSGRDDLYLTIHRWFDHTLKGVDNGIDREPRFDVQDTRARWRHEADWPPRDALAHTLFLSSDGTLTIAMPDAGSLAIGGAASLPGALLGSTQRHATFTSAPFPDGIHIAGAPVLRVTLASDRPVGQVIARLYDEQRIVTQGALDLLYRDDLAQADPVPMEFPIEVAFALDPVDHAVAPGGKLRLVLMTQDPTSWYEDDVSAATLTIVTGVASDLTIPTIERSEEDFFLFACGWRPVLPAPGCWEARDDLGTSN